MSGKRSNGVAGGGGRKIRIRRDYYLKQLFDREQNGMIKVITGIRRSGKSYLLFELFKTALMERGVAADHIIEVNLDDYGNERLQERKVLYDFVKKSIRDDDVHYVLLDEIQYVAGFESVLNGFLHVPNLDVYVTGSNSKFLSSDIITEFRGRGDQVRVYPLSFAEFYTAYVALNPEAAQGRELQGEALQEYMIYGGLPQIVTMASRQQKTEYLKGLYQTTYLRDLIDRHRLRHTEEFDDLINVVASAVGSLTNPSKLENTFKSAKKSSITAKTIRQYLGYLEDAFLIDHAHRFDVKGKRYINSLLKYYFTDVGLRNALLDFRQVEETHLMENIIFMELKRRGYSVDVGIVEIREQGKARTKLEIDFVANRGDKKYYIQSAYAMHDADKREQEIRPLIKVGDSFKKIVVVANTLFSVTRDDNGILTLSLLKFLLDENSLEL